jgi:hypothetical protein
LRFEDFKRVFAMAGNSKKQIRKKSKNDPGILFEKSI